MFSTKTAGWIALITVLLFATLVGLQVAEWLSYSGEPSVWVAAR